jgi:hypothetical protein
MIENTNNIKDYTTDAISKIREGALTIAKEKCTGIKIEINCVNNMRGVDCKMRITTDLD